MKHAEFKRIGEGRTAVLLVHGILGTPRHFDPFMPLIPEEYSVWNLLLDGHGKTVRDFSKSSMKKWERQVAAAVEELAQTHERILIAAHSMGTLFAIEQAIRQPKVTALYLLAAPLKIFVKSDMFLNAAKVYLNRIDEQKPLDVAAKNSLSMETDWNLIQYMGWVPRYLELFEKIRRTCVELPRLEKPCFAYQSAGDEMVAQGAAKQLARNPRIRVTVLENSRHFYYEQKDLEFLQKEFASFMELGREQKE